MPHLDITLVVVDESKYGDQALFEELRELPQSPGNLYFVFNKIDNLNARYAGGFRAVLADILADFLRKLRQHTGWRIEEERLLPLSARGAFLARSGAAAIFQ